MEEKQGAKANRTGKALEQKIKDLFIEKGLKYTNIQNLLRKQPNAILIILLTMLLKMFLTKMLMAKLVELNLFYIIMAKIQGLKQNGKKLLEA